MDVDVSSSIGPATVSSGELTDLELVMRVRSGERGLFEQLMRRHNERLYRAARAVMGDESDIEDIMQQAYMNAFAHLDEFESRSQFSTWLTRIVLNEAFARRRRRRRTVLAADAAEERPGQRDSMDELNAPQPDPERQAYASELQRLLEGAVDQLPASYRVAFVLRDVEGLSTAEAGEALGLREEAVKTRLHRARAMIRKSITAQIGAVAPDTFHFHAVRCNRVVNAVLERIANPSSFDLRSSS